MGEAARNAPGNASKEAGKSEKQSRSRKTSHICRDAIKKWRVTPHEAQKLI
jgi:hypothetical protein